MGTPAVDVTMNAAEEESEHVKKNVKKNANANVEESADGIGTATETESAIGIGIATADVNARDVPVNPRARCRLHPQDHQDLLLMTVGATSQNMPFAQPAHRMVGKCSGRQGKCLTMQLTLRLFHHVKEKQRCGEHDWIRVSKKCRRSKQARPHIGPERKHPDKLPILFSIQYIQSCEYHQPEIQSHG